MPVLSLNLTSLVGVPSGKLAGRSTAGTGQAEALSIDASLLLATGTLSLNLANANTWTALQTFNNGLAVASGKTLTFNADAILSRKAAANLQLGAADAAAPVAQTLSVQDVVAGTTNTAGANLTIAGSQGTGTGAGGSILFQVAPAGLTGTAQNALTTVLTLGTTTACTVNAPAATSVGLVVAGAASQSADIQEWKDSSGNILARIAPILSQGNATIFEVNSSKQIIQNTIARFYGYQAGTVDLTQGTPATAASPNLTSPYLQLVGSNYTAGTVTSPAGIITFTPTFATGGYLSLSVGNITNEGLRVWRNENRAPIVGINSSLTTAQLSVIPNWTGKIGIVVQAVAGQTADLQEWQNSTGASLASVSASGTISAPAFVPAFAKKTAAYTLTAADNLITADATTAAFAVTLPAANSLTAGRSYTVKKIDSSANAVTLTAAGTDKIDGAATYALATQYKYVTVTTDGVSAWLIEANN